MNNELVKFELQEKDLELVISERTLGSLITNARQIKEVVALALPNYDISNYNEDNIALAKKDKSMLNAASKALNDKRIQYEKEFMQPFSEFKTVIAETVALIKECSGKIDEVVKQSEESEKQMKRIAVETLWAKKNFNLVSLAKIFDSKWLNKSVSLKTIDAEIDKLTANINNDMVTIETIGEDEELLKSLYLDTLDLNKTIQYAHTLKQNREKAKADAEIRASCEAKKNCVAEKNIDEAATAVKCRTAAEVYVRAFKVTTSRENIIKLSEFMKECGIEFERIEI